MDDKKVSYSIYIERRSVRILYVFNKNEITLANIDAIIDYNKRKWGGRYNFILLTENNRITEDQWKFLDQYDPDFVKLSIPVTKRLAINLDTKITPIQATSETGPRGFSPQISEEGISILPAINNINQIGNSFINNVYYVMFNVDNCQDQIIKDFIIRNFGTTDLRNVSNLSLRDYPNNKIIDITSKQSFIDALASFNDFKPYVFPIQLCSIGDFMNEDRAQDDDDNFYVFVGDDPSDLVDFWNNPLYLHSWTRKFLRQIWIPSSLAEDPELKDALTKFIHGRADAYGNGQKKVVYSTRSLSDARIKSIADSLTDSGWLFKETRVKTAEKYPEYVNYFSFDRIKTGMEHFRGAGEEEKIIVPPPDITEGVMGGEYWMNDLYIQVPERKVVPVNFETWLQLPKNNSVAHTVIQGSPARITKDGLPSVLLSRSNRFNSSSQDITIKTPKTNDIFASIILNTGKPYFTNDIRTIYTKPYKYTIGVSGAGRHIHGFLQVFGSLEGAYQVFEERHWRLFFDLIANVSDVKESKRLMDIKTRLVKKITPMISNPSNFIANNFIDWLSRDMQKTAKIYSDAAPKAGSLKDLEEIAKNELVEYNARNPGNKIRFLKRTLMQALKRLTDNEIVVMGYELKCPNCLNKEWRGLNEINQINTCRGCGYQNPFSPNMEIMYRLNSLVENGVRIKGVVPVVLGLGTIFRDARNYFDFLPPVNIYKKGKLITDLDICCVIDGQFVIGEVKAHQGLFHTSDFEKIKKLAKEIHPNKVVFCSLDKIETQRIKEEVQKVNTELLPFGIKAEWLPFDSYMFEATPMY